MSDSKPPHTAWGAVVVGLLSLALASAAFAQPDTAELGMPAAEQGKTLAVGTKAAPPFVLVDGDGNYSGISITLWQEVADKLGVEYQYKQRDLKGLLTGLEHGSLDISVAALTVTGPREEKIDFSYPFYSTGLAIAVHSSGRGSRVWSTIRRFFSWQFFTALAALAVLLLGVGFVVWLFERRANPEEFGGHPVQGLGAGFWWAAVTMTTVGYGDKSPRSLGGRIVGLVWMFAAIILISSFTAAIATSLTVGQLSTGIEGVQDLPGKRVATVANSAATDTLRERGIAFSTRSDMAAALDDLAGGRIDAVVYDAPLLRYRVLKDYADRVSVLTDTFDRQDYAFALPQGSDLREPINRAILDFLARDAWQQTLTQYLGEKR